MYIYINGDHHMDLTGQVHYDTYQYIKDNIGAKTVRSPATTEEGVWILRKSATLLYIDCNGQERDPTLWSTACCRLSLQYAANWEADARLTYSYVLSPDPRNKLTCDDLMDLAKDCVRECFPGHDALIAVHMDTDVPHVHITISNIRGRDVEPRPWMERDKDGQIAKSQYMAGYKHASSASFRHHINEWAFAACQERGWVDKNSNVLIKESRQQRYGQANLIRANYMLDAADRVVRVQDFCFCLISNGLDLTYTGKSQKLAVRDLAKPKGKAIKLDTLGISEDMILRRIYGADKFEKYVGTLRPLENVPARVIDRTSEIFELDTFLPVDAATQQRLQGALQEAALRMEACTRVYHSHCYHITGSTTDSHYTASSKGTGGLPKRSEKKQAQTVAALRQARQQHRQALRNYKVYSDSAALLADYRQYVLTLAEDPRISDEEVVRARRKYLAAIRRLASADEQVVRELRRHLRDMKHSQMIRDAHRSEGAEQKIATAQQERVIWQPAVTSSSQLSCLIRPEEPKRRTMWNLVQKVIAEHGIEGEIDLHMERLRRYAAEHEGEIPRGSFVPDVAKVAVDSTKAGCEQEERLLLPTNQSLIQVSTEETEEEEYWEEVSTEEDNGTHYRSLEELLRGVESRTQSRTSKDAVSGSRSKHDVDYLL